MVVKTLKKEIIKNKKIQGGVPVFKGTRIPVAQVFSLLSRGMAPKEIVDSYPITKNQIKIALEYASNQFNGNSKTV